MSLLKSVAKNTIIQIVGKAVSTGLGLFAIGLMTRNLGVEKFGWYITVTGFMQFVGIFADFGFTIITANMLSEPTFDKQKLLNNLFTWRFITATIFHGLAPLIFLFLPYPWPVKIAAFITTLSFFFTSINNVFIGNCQANLKMSIQIGGEIVGRIVLVAGLLLVSFQKYGFIPSMLIITIASGIYTLYLWIRSPKVRFAIDKTISKAIYSKMWPTALSVIFNVFYLQGDRVILPLYASQSDVGLYGAAYRVLDIVTQGAAIVMGIMAPLVSFAWSRNMFEEFKKRYQSSFDFVLLLLFPMMAGIYALADKIMLLIGGNEFVPSGNILKILSIAIIGIAIGNIFGYLILTINKQKKSLWIYFITAIISIILYLVFIPKYGIYGAAWVSVFSEIFAGTLLMIMSMHYSKIKISLIPPIKITVASLAMGWIISTLNLPLILSVVLGMVIYATLILLLRTIPKETIDHLLKSTT